MQKGPAYYIRRVLQVLRSKLQFSTYSNLDEQSVILKYLEALVSKGKSGYCVDIGASDGVSMSNTYALYKKGWGGLSVELDDQKFISLSENCSAFTRVSLVKDKATPANIISLFSENQVPKDFDFLSIDIDGYDYFVLEEILSKYRPKLICTEINEKIPPPIKFTVNWDPSYYWAEDHFYGQSISQIHALAASHNYSLVELHYNNAFLIPAEYAIKPPLSPEDAYRVGYKEKADRKEKFPWNSDMELLLEMKPDEALNFVNHFFEKYNGRYSATIQ